MIRVDDLKKSFGKLKVLDGVQFEIGKPGIISILGPNGSGKTTFLKIFLGMVLPDSGHISVNDTIIRDSHEYRNDIGYLPQIAQFPDNLTVREIIEMISDIRGENIYPKELLDLFKLESYLDKKLGNLSGGTRQKVNIVLTFMFDNPLIILDEPTAGLDPVSLLRFKELLASRKKEGKLILITSHIMSVVEELSDEVIFLLDGKVYFKGTLKELNQKTGTSDLEHAIASILES